MNETFARLSFGALLLVLATKGFKTRREPFGRFWKMPGSSSSLCNETCSSHYTDPAALTIQNLYSSIVESDCDLANPSDYPPHYSPADGEEFDFIIVGAGSAGSVVANRLTEMSGWTVLLLEAGGDPTKTTEVPALTRDLEKSDVDWQHKTDPRENNCLGMKNRQCNYPAGKVLGGSSTINNMFYLRGNMKDYERWEADGNIGWGYKDVLPYFKKSEDMRAEEVLRFPGSNNYHSVGGNLKVETWQRDGYESLDKAFTEGMKELGYFSNPDCNGKIQSGFVTRQGTLQDGRRCSTAKAFLTPIISRDSLKVSKHSFVSKILIDERQNTAYGVEFYNKNGQLVRVLAKKEVIVSAGTINTPPLLMLSGIGPKKHLEELNIKVVKDLPVGENLQDHPLMLNLVISLNFSRSTESPEESMFDFLLKKPSRYSETGFNYHAGFLNIMNGINYPDIEITFPDFEKNSSAALKSLLGGFGVRDDLIDKYAKINSDSFITIAQASFLRERSRGKILLNSANPKESPKILSGYFIDQRDFEIFLRLYDFIYRFVETKGMKSLNAKLHEIYLSECSMFPFSSREQRMCSLRYLTSSTYHYTSTCRMGPPDSDNSVVDPSLRVKGVNGLRVVDASVFPYVTAGNTNSVVIMVAEKGSDLIKDSWLSRKSEKQSKISKISQYWFI